MYAVEFESNIDNGFVKIPTQYKKVLQSNRVKVILMVENEPKKDKTDDKVFDNFLTHTQKVEMVKQINRDELHDR
jgi:signal recognition particle receptor subunit beta